MQRIIVVQYLIQSLLTFISFLTIEVSYGQNFSYPQIKQTGHSLKDFVPTGWEILDAAVDDLNKDKLEDAVIILQYEDSVKLLTTGEIEDSVLTQPRLLIILLKNYNDNNFYLIEENHSFILNHDNPTMDDPFQAIKISDGLLQIDFHLFYNMGTWFTTNTTYKFRYQDKQFVLIGADYSSIHRATLDFEDYSYNFLTKKRRLTKGNETKGTNKIYWKRININVLMTLKKFIKPYTWEVETDMYL